MLWPTGRGVTRAAVDRRGASRCARSTEAEVDTRSHREIGSDTLETICRSTLGGRPDCFGSCPKQSARPMLLAMAWLMRTLMIFGLLLSPLQVCQASPLPMGEPEMTFGCNNAASPDDSGGDHRNHSSPDCRVACAAAIPMPDTLDPDFAGARSYSTQPGAILTGHLLPVATPPPRSGSPIQRHNQI